MLLVAAAGCSSEPEFVYILEAPQTVLLTASASSTRVRAGESVVLHVTRRTKGLWKRIPSSERAPDQCWMTQPPPEIEEEVADNVHWDVTPTGSARFSIDFRADHTRLVFLDTAGQITLTPSTVLWCEPGRAVPAQVLQIEVVSVVDRP
jgi:hypothetical protein